MSYVELIYHSDCPNVAQARAALLEAFAQLHRSPSWTEWDRKARQSPAYVRRYGSPTILVNGTDVAGVDPGEGADSCRIYTDTDGTVRGVPPVEHIVATLSNGDASAAAAQCGWRRLLAVLPGVAAALLPAVTCPACWPVYAAVLATLGFGFLLDTTSLFPLTAVLLAVALASFASRAKTRQGYRLLTLGVVGVGLTLAGKFVLSSDPLWYLGLTLFVGASLWNAWAQRAATTGACVTCAPQDWQINDEVHTKEVRP